MDHHGLESLLTLVNQEQLHAALLVPSFASSPPLSVRCCTSTADASRPLAWPQPWPLHTSDLLRQHCPLQPQPKKNSIKESEDILEQGEEGNVATRRNVRTCCLSGTLYLRTRIRRRLTTHQLRNTLGRERGVACVTSLLAGLVPIPFLL